MTTGVLEYIFCTAQKLEEAKREARRRGDKKTQTSDAKFDEKFQVGHGLSGEANKPWYAKSSSMLQPEEAAQLQVIYNGLHIHQTSYTCACDMSRALPVHMQPWTDRGAQLSKVGFYPAQAL